MLTRLDSSASAAAGTQHTCLILLADSISIRLKVTFVNGCLWLAGSQLACYATISSASEGHRWLGLCSPLQLLLQRCPFRHTYVRLAEGITGRFTPWPII